MPKYILYYRVSTEKQDYQQQQEAIDGYLSKLNNPEVVVFEENTSSTSKRNKRVLNDILDLAEKGDIIVASELSRFTRPLPDIIAFAEKCRAAGVYLTLVQQNLTITPDPNDIVSSVVLWAFALASDLELKGIRQRTRSALAARKESIKRDGGFTSKRGNECTKLGNPDPTYALECAVAAASRSHTERRQNDPAWARAKALADSLKRRGDGLAAITETLNSLGYPTRTGGNWSKTTVCRLLKQ